MGCRRGIVAVCVWGIFWGLVAASAPPRERRHISKSRVTSPAQLLLDELMPLARPAQSERRSCDRFHAQLQTRLKWTGSSGVVTLPHGTALRNARQILKSYPGPVTSEIRRWGTLAAAAEMSQSLGEVEVRRILTAFDRAGNACAAEEVFEDLAVLIRETVRLSLPDADRKEMFQLAWKLAGDHLGGPPNFGNVRRTLSVVFRLVDSGLANLAPEVLTRLREIDGDLQKARSVSASDRDSEDPMKRFDRLRGEAKKSAELLERLKGLEIW